VRTKIILQTELGDGIHPWFVGTIAIVGVAGLMDGKQDFLQQVIHFIGEAEAFSQERPEEPRGFLQYFGVGTLVPVEGVPHQRCKMVSFICHAIPASL